VTVSNRIARAHAHGFTAGRNGHEYDAADYGSSDLVDAYSRGYQDGYAASYRCQIASPSERLRQQRLIAARVLP
jgi:ribosome modulation factor